MAKKNEGLNPQELQVIADPKKMVAKLATKVTLSQSPSSDNVILTFLSGVGGEQPIVIERVVLDKQTIREVTKFLNEMEEESDAK